MKRLSMIGCALVALFALGLWSTGAFAQDAATQPSAGQPAAGDATQTPDQIEAAAKDKDIRKLLDLSRSGELGVQAAGQMIDSMKQTMPNVPQKFWDDFMKEVNPDALIDLVVPVYRAHFSHDEIKQLIAFYESPIGLKLTAEQPAIMQESMTAGQEWGRQLGEKIAKKLQDGGYMPAQRSAGPPRNNKR